jgi:hypothetical protein
MWELTGKDRKKWRKRSIGQGLLRIPPEGVV